MKIAIVGSEAYPFSKTGGLGDVTGSLFREFQKMGHDVYLFTPLYRCTIENFGHNIEKISLEFDIPLGRDIKHCKIYTYSKELEGSPQLRRDPSKNIFFIGNDEFFNRQDLYEDQSGAYSDNDARFAFFCKGVIELIKVMELRLDIIHCNDWQTGLIPLYLKTLYLDSEFFRDTRTVFTIHNIAYQGLFTPASLELLGLGMEFLNPEGIEFYGNISYLKAGILWSDVITTVSNSYAREILTPEFGFGMEGVLNKRSQSLLGIPNGIDYTEWNPASDPNLPYSYTRAKLTGKMECKRELIKRCAFKDEIDKPLFAFVGRLSYQKGLDLLISSLTESIMRDLNLVIIGKGEEQYKRLLSYLKSRFPEKIFFYNGFDESLAHLTYAGSDVFLMPSRYEPCGIGQMIAMRYGTITIGRKTGGLSDTIEDGRTGFLFEEFSREALTMAIKIALNTFKFKKLWIEMIKDSMSRDFSWKKSAQKYLTLYSDIRHERQLS